MSLYRIPFRWNLLMNVCGEDVTKEEMDKQENRTEDEDHFMQPWPEYEVSANTKTQKRFSNPARSSTYVLGHIFPGLGRERIRWQGMEGQGTVGENFNSKGCWRDISAVGSSI